MDSSLIHKYNTSVPRYTSYPTVPDWQLDQVAEDHWIDALHRNYNPEEGISLYTHLPFCESLCTYCGCNKRITTNHQMEAPYIDAVLQEWSIYVNRIQEPILIKELHLGGGTPTFFSVDNLARLIDGIKTSSTLHKTYEFSFEAHPNSTTKAHLEKMYDLGFRRVSIGVQDVSPSILKAINRKQSCEEVADITRWAKAIGYTSVNYDIIYGLPFQKPINILDTIQFIEAHRPDRIAFYSYAHVPWKSASQRAYTIEDVPSGLFKNDLYSLGRMMLTDAGYHGVGMDHFCLQDEELHQSYLQGYMHRNFMGYTSRYTTTTIALGVSAIGDAGSMFVQNEKHVETYQNIVLTGRLPLIKGHALTEGEILMRGAILDLMCRDRLDLSKNEALKKLVNPYLSNLFPMIEDGLISFDGEVITVSDNGRYLVRNIVAAIDPMYQQQQLENKYSQAI